MNTKEQLIQILEEHPEEYYSGSRIADLLGISRSAVWKWIRQLQEEGWEIEAVTNRGYRLGGANDVFTEASLRRCLGPEADRFHLEVHDSVTSTNTLMKARAAELPDWTVIAAGHQSAGRGRMGRSFYSPAGTGVYLSVLLRPRLTAWESTRITTMAAVAACRAIEECTGEKPGIKWVNDVFLHGRKVCGILTEASLDMETKQIDWAVMGIGLDVYAPEGGYPEELAGIAGAIAPRKEKDLRSRLTAAFLTAFRDLAEDLGDTAFIEEYRKRSFLIGQPVDVLRETGAVPALVLDIDEECRLLVQYGDGTREALSSGEVSVRPLPAAGSSKKQTPDPSDDPERRTRQ